MLLRHLNNKFFRPLKFTFSSISEDIKALSYFFIKDLIVFEILNDSSFSEDVELANCKYSFNIFSISSMSSESFFEILLSLIKANCNFILVSGVLKSWLIPDNISDL